MIKAFQKEVPHRQYNIQFHQVLKIFESSCVKYQIIITNPKMIHARPIILNELSFISVMYLNVSLNLFG